MALRLQFPDLAKAHPSGRQLGYRGGVCWEFEYRRTYGEHSSHFSTPKFVVLLKLPMGGKSAEFVMEVPVESVGNGLSPTSRCKKSCMTLTLRIELFFEGLGRVISELNWGSEETREKHLRRGRGIRP